jgi:dolichol-phosphate mannosyltransferase
LKKYENVKMKAHHSDTVAVVIPSYRVKKHILSVINAIGPEISRIYIVDDACPEQTGDYVEGNCNDPRVQVLRHLNNRGVGGAVISGYQAALTEGHSVVVKIDGDGQMNPELIPEFIRPILTGEADYTKGNRFFNLENLRQMPKIRLFGNAVLSFMTKLSSGYWNIFDPTNGYTAIHSDLVRELPLSKISNRYFFETDMLFRLGTLRALVIDVPMSAKYSDEVSSLKIANIFGEFLFKHLRNFCKRIFYNYYLRDMSLASIELPLGVSLFTFGALFGAWHWLLSAKGGFSTPNGTIMIAALTILMGMQLILAFLSFDIASVPRRPIHKRS